MKSKDFLKEGFVEDAHDVHLDHEVQMARADCFHAAEDALVLHKLLRNIDEQQGLEGWVASKLTLAADYLKTVREYLEYEMMTGYKGAANQTVTTDASMLPIAEGKDYSVTVKHTKDGKTSDHEYTVKNANDKRHAKNIALQRHEKKVGGLKDGEQISASSNHVKEVVAEGERKLGPAPGSHTELARLAHDAYVQATRKGNGIMANHYLKQYMKHKALAASKKQGVAEGTQQIGVGSKVYHPIHGSGKVVKHSTGPGADHWVDVKFVSGDAKRVNRKHLKLEKEQSMAEGLSEMDNRTPSDDRREQRANRPEEKARREKEQQERLKKISPEMRKKLRLPEPKQESVAEGSERKDMTGQTCEKCKKDKYEERSQHDDMEGKVTCSCGHRVNRWKNYKEQGVAEADKHSFVGKIQRGHELKKKVDSSWKDIGDAQKAGDKAAGSRAFRKHERYANLERPGTWTKVDEQGVAEGSGETNAQEMARLRRELKTTKDPQRAEYLRLEIRKLKGEIELRRERKGVAEGTGNLGRQIKALYQKIDAAGPDAADYMYWDSPIFAQYWDEYEGDLDSIIAEVDPQELQVIFAELQSAAEDQGLAEGSMKRIVGYRVVGTDIFIPVKDFEQDGRYYELRGYEFEPVWDDEQGVAEEQVNETSAGSVATVVNPTPKNKAKVGTLFGGTYKQKKAK